MTNKSVSRINNVLFIDYSVIQITKVNDVCYKGNSFVNVSHFYLVILPEGATLMELVSDMESTSYKAALTTKA